MMTRQEFRLASCLNKVAFDTEWDAKLIARKMKGKFKRLDKYHKKKPKVFRVYKCLFESHYHVTSTEYPQKWFPRDAKEL